MNYGYDSTTPLWKEERKQQLVERLVALIHLNDDEATRRPYVTEPYVETDGLYTGVRIRQITNCPLTTSVGRRAARTTFTKR